MSHDVPMQVQSCINRINSGDAAARNELIDLAYESLVRLTRKLSRSYSQVKRWEQTDDVANAACLRLQRALATVELHDARHFFRLAALNIRRELVDLARHYYGAEGMGNNHATHEAFSPQADSSPRLHYEKAVDTHEPRQLAQMTELHRRVEQLSEESKETFDMLYYSDMPQNVAAELLGVSTKTMQRRWRRAQIELGKLLSRDDM